MADDVTRSFPDQYMLRLPEGMRDKLKSIAKDNSRSLNAEIIARLQLTLEDRGGDLSAFGADALMRRLEASTAAAEEFAQRLVYELYLAGDLGFPDHEAITSALDAYGNTLDQPMSRHHLVSTILRDWLIGHGFIPFREDPEMAN